MGESERKTLFDNPKRKKGRAPLSFSDHDINEAMEEIQGYFDITPGDFREIYTHAFQHALSRIEPKKRASQEEPVSPPDVVRTRGVPAFFRKMRGSTVAPARVSLSEVLWSWVGAFLGIFAVGFIHYFVLEGGDLVMIIGSFGASAVLIYGAIKSPLAQPRNLVGGHLLSALVGVGLYQLLPQPLWITSALAVATAIALMHLTRTLHPPGGATALIAVIGSQRIHDLGFLYALFPAGLGALVMLGVALLVNNAVPSRRYPEFWI